MDTQIIFKSNRKSTQRMQQMIHGLSDVELSKTTGNNWSMAVTLAHLAFWDQRVIHVIETAKKNDVLNAPLFDDQLNDILTPILEAIPPVQAAKLAVDIAGKLDGLLEECPTDLIQQMMKKNNRLVERSLHRNDHLNEIESVIKGQKNLRK